VPDLAGQALADEQAAVEDQPAADSGA